MLNESEQRGASGCCGDPHRRVAWGCAVEAKEDRPTESCHNGGLRGPGEGFCAASQSHLHCPSAQCPKTEGLASQEANTTTVIPTSLSCWLFILKTGPGWSGILILEFLVLLLPLPGCWDKIVHYLAWFMVCRGGDPGFCSCCDPSPLLKFYRNIVGPYTSVVLQESFAFYFLVVNVYVAMCPGRWDPWSWGSRQ